MASLYFLVRSVAGALGRTRGHKNNEAQPTATTSMLLSLWLTEAARDSCQVLRRQIGIPYPESDPPVCASQSADNERLDSQPTCTTGRFESLGTRSAIWQTYQEQRICIATVVQRASSGAIHRVGEEQSPGSGSRGFFSRKRSRRQGYKIEKYVLERKLGAGAFAEVFVARNLETQEKVAIKVFDRADIVGPSGTKAQPTRKMRRLMSEIASMMAVRHPYIVRLHEVLRDKRSIYLIMEYMPGGTLFDKMQAGRHDKSEDVARKYFQQLWDAVSFCHGKGVFHRDLKPENLLLDALGTLKVADFGLSEITSDSNRVGSTAFTSAVGTDGYMAPEVIRSYRGVSGYSGATADIWSCGIILFELLCGHAPFDMRDSGVMEKILTSTYTVAYHVPASARKLIHRMLDPCVATRITAAGIYSNDWFKIGYRPPDFRQIPEVEANLQAVEAVEAVFNDYQSSSPVNPPATLSAFQLLSQTAPVDLSSLVQRRPGDSGTMEETRLASRLPAADILQHIGQAGMTIGFTVQIRGFKMKLVAQQSSPRPILCIVGEVFEIPGTALFMVILRKVTGDSQDYDKFSSMLCNVVKDTMVMIKTR